MASPGALNLTTVQGDTAARTLTFERTDTTGATTPVDLTGMTALAQVRKSVRDPNIAATMTFTVVNAAAGKARLVLSATASDTLRPGNYVWDLQLTSTDGDVRTWLSGTLIVNPGVSR